ncbi:MAG: hypothetical protein IJO08_02995 [Clostridia bacterium]|nr:hypothetical protein [Clostridia bacterium]
MNNRYVSEGKEKYIHYRNTENLIVTKAEYDSFHKNKKMKYISEYVSIIDVPYRRYKLI